MPVKRRKHGRRKINGGAGCNVKCTQCGARVPKDKANSRSTNNPVVEAASMDDLRVATIYKAPKVPTFFNTENHCVSCACHLKIVKVRSKEDRKIRFVPRQRLEN